MRPRRLIFAVSVVLSFGAGGGSGELQMRKEGPRVFVQASGVALSEVLDRLASATGMTVVYDGPRPHRIVTLQIEGQSEVEAVQALFEGQGISYALTLDRTGLEVELLILITDTAGAAAPSGSRTSIPPPESVGAESPPEEFPAELEPAPDGEREMPPSFPPHETIDPWAAPDMPSFPSTPSNPARLF